MAQANPVRPDLKELQYRLGVFGIESLSREGWAAVITYASGVEYDLEMLRLAVRDLIVYTDHRQGCAVKIWRKTESILPRHSSEPECDCGLGGAISVALGR